MSPASYRAAPPRGGVLPSLRQPVGARKSSLLSRPGRQGVGDGVGEGDAPDPDLPPLLSAATARSMASSRRAWASPYAAKSLAFRAASASARASSASASAARRAALSPVPGDAVPVGVGVGVGVPPGGGGTSPVSTP